jgi:hypothetical protein
VIIRTYNNLKRYGDQIYSGMKVGGSHKWHYDNGKWIETKLSPEKWKFKFDSVKTRFHQAPLNSGAENNTKFHWFIIANQIATKLDKDSYMTEMNGVKFKVGHKRPEWSAYTYDFPKQESYTQKVIKILEDTLSRLKNQNTGIRKFT